MKKLLAHLLGTIVIMAIAMGLFLGVFYYEGNFVTTVVTQKMHQLVLKTDADTKIQVNRMGSNVELSENAVLETGDIIDTQDNLMVIMKFAGDGELRMDKQTRLLVDTLDEANLSFAFKLLQGRVWLVNSYSNADVNLYVDGGVIIPAQSVIYVAQADGKADVYANSLDAVVGFLPTDYGGSGVIDEHAEEIINSLYLPQGTMLSVYADKVQENQSTIARLLFSKLVKEFNYSVFDKNALISDEFLSKNQLEDVKMRARVRDERLKKIKTRGLKYSSLDASNYHVDESIREMANLLTFSEEKVANRNLEALFDLLYDSQYLFDYGRKDEAEERLRVFASSANQLVLVYGSRLKNNYVARVKNEYEYLSFATPSDSLFGLKQVLQQVYLDSLKGAPEELETKFTFLKEDLNTIAFYAENEQGKNLALAITKYMDSIKLLLSVNEQDIVNNMVLLQRQNQALDNLFTQYPALYRQGFFTNKLFLENKYLSLLPNGNNKLEEIQSVIANRIDFLKKLQRFYLDGDVPTIDAQNISALLFSEIAKIELPESYQVAVKQLFTDRLQDYGIFNRFLNSQEYVSSSLRGATPQERFEQFKKDNTQEVSIDLLQEEMAKQAAGDGNQYELGTVYVPEEIVVETQPVINEELVTTEIDGQVNTTENQVDLVPETQPKIKVPRVKPTN